LKGYINWKTEYRNDDESLDDQKVYDNVKLFIEKGKPMKEGEIKIEMMIFDPYMQRQGDKKEPIEDLFFVVADENTLIYDFKVQMSKKLKEEKSIDIDVKFMRIRDVFTDKPYKVYNNDATIKSTGRSFYEKKLMIQWLNEEDISKKDNEQWIFVQQFVPSEFTVKERYEILVDKNASLEEMKKFLSAKYGIKHLGVTTRSVDFPGYPLINIPEMNWDEQKTSKSSRTTYFSFNFTEGECLYYKDNREELKELSPEEKKELEKEAAKAKRVTNSYRYKEEALTINAKA